MSWSIAFSIFFFSPLTFGMLRQGSNQGQVLHYILNSTPQNIGEISSDRALGSRQRDYQLKYFHFSDGMQIAVAEFAPSRQIQVSKVPLLLGPGYLAPMTYLFPLARALSAFGHPVIVVEPPGQGKKEFASTGSSSGFSYTMEGMASLYLPDIVGEVSRAYNSSISVVGHSRFGHILRLLIALDGLVIDPTSLSYSEVNSPRARSSESKNSPLALMENVFFLLSPLSISNPTFRSLVLNSPKLMNLADQLERFEDASLRRIPFGLGEVLRPLQRSLYLRGGLALFENQSAFQLLMGENWDRDLLRETLVNSGGSAKPIDSAVEEMESLIDSSQREGSNHRWNSLGKLQGTHFSLLERYLRAKSKTPANLWAISAEFDESYDIFLRELKDAEKILELTGATHAGPLFDPEGDMKAIVRFISIHSQSREGSTKTCTKSLNQ